MSDFCSQYPATCKAINNLTDQEFTTLAYLFGLNSADVYLNSKTIAQNLGVSSSRITILKAQGLTKLSSEEIRQEFSQMMSINLASVDTDDIIEID